MIERVKSFKVGIEYFETFEEAQREELRLALLTLQDLDGTKFSNEFIVKFADFLQTNKESFSGILSSTPRSRPRARKANGATRKRKSLPKTIAASETGT